MSDFWTRKLAGGSPAQVPASGPQRHAPASSRPWWDQSGVVEAEPTRWQPEGTRVLYDAEGNAVLVGPNNQVLAVEGHPGELNAESIAHHTRSARKAKANQEHCPECDSSDYPVIGKLTGQNGTVEARRCFDCGYPVIQRGSGMKDLTGGKAVGAARQVEHGGKVNMFSAQGLQAPAFAAEHGGPSR